MANSIASDIIGIAEGVTKIDSSSIGLSGLETGSLLQIIDKANREYFDKELLGGGENKLLQSEAGADLVADTTLGEDITSATTDFDVALSTAYPSSGALAIWDNGMDIVEFTGNAANNFTGVTGIGASHEDGDAVSKLYPLPPNFGTFRSTDVAVDGMRVNGQSYTYVDGEPYGARFSVYTASAGTKYLIFPKGTSGSYEMTYNKLPTVIDEESDTIDVPVNDEDFVVYRLVEYIYRVLGTMDKIGDARAMANKVMQDSLKRRNVGKRPRLGRRIEINVESINLSRLFP